MNQELIMKKTDASPAVLRVYLPVEQEREWRISTEARLEVVGGLWRKWNTVTLLMMGGNFKRETSFWDETWRQELFECWRERKDTGLENKLKLFGEQTEEPVWPEYRELEGVVGREFKESPWSLGEEFGFYSKGGGKPLAVLNSSAVPGT